jgi:hypothetical protein
MQKRSVFFGWARRVFSGLLVSSLVYPIACSSDKDSRSADLPTDEAGGNAGANAKGGAGANTKGGASAHTNAAAGTDASTPKDRIGDEVFNENEVKSYYLTFSEEEYARLMDLSTLLVDPTTVNKDRYVEAALRVGDVKLPSIGVRFKGNYSIWGCVDSVTGERAVRVEPFFGNIDVCQRFSLKLDFNQFVDGARLDGLKKLNLQAMAADPSKMRERLSYSLFRDMDILAPRAVHARVYINGKYHGLFSAVENIDGRFTANRFPEAGDGNLYQDLWPTAELSPADAEYALQTNKDPGSVDVSDFMAFRDAVVSATEADFAKKLSPYVDLDYLARYIVVDRAIASSDGIIAFYSGLGWGPFNQNYNWYNSGQSHFILIPWDFDKAFWFPEPNFWSNNAPNGLNVVPNWNVVTTGCNDYECSFDSKVVYDGVVRELPYYVRQIDCDPFLRLLRGAVYDRQKAIAEDFIAGPFSKARVVAKLEAWRAQVKEAIAEDPGVDSAQWQAAIDEMIAKLPDFQQNLSLMMNGLIEE